MVTNILRDVNTNNYENWSIVVRVICKIRRVFTVQNVIQALTFIRHFVHRFLY